MVEAQGEGEEDEEVNGDTGNVTRET